jgi:hypothetical protein
LLPVGILEVSDSKGRATAGVVDDVFDDSLKKKKKVNHLTGKKEKYTRTYNEPLSRTLNSRCKIREKASYRVLTKKDLLVRTDKDGLNKISVSGSDLYRAVKAKPSWMPVFYLSNVKTKQANGFSKRLA